MRTAVMMMAAIAGGGLVLGALGGHFARPVMQQRGGDEPWRKMLEPEVDRYEDRVIFEAPPQDLDPYGGRYSHPPAFADRAIDRWPAPSADSGWPEPPTIAELEARWAAEDAAESAAMAGEPSLGASGAAARAERAAGEAQAAAAQGEPVAEVLPREPRAAGTRLPAIW